MGGYYLLTVHKEDTYTMTLILKELNTGLRRQHKNGTSSTTAIGKSNQRNVISLYMINKCYKSLGKREASEAYAWVCACG